MSPVDPDPSEGLGGTPVGTVRYFSVRLETRSFAVYVAEYDDDPFSSLGSVTGYSVIEILPDEPGERRPILPDIETSEDYRPGPIRRLLDPETSDSDRVEILREIVRAAFPPLPA